MSDKEETPDDSIDDSPPPPPPIMPTPDIVDGSKEGPTYGGDPNKQSKGSRSHPLDPYEPLKKKKGCGCCGCLGTTLLLGLVLFVALVIAIGWAGPGRYVFDGYEVVNFGEEQVVVTDAPAEPTCYVGQKIDYQVPETGVSIAIIGAEVSIRGHFKEDISITGAKVFGRAATTIAGDLEVFAAEFYDEGIQLAGELKGSVMKNVNP